MSFSIRFLLAIIVLTALGVNVWRMKIQLLQMDAEIAQLKRVAGDRRPQLTGFDRKQLAYERSFAAAKKFADQFAGAEPAFERLVEKYGQFKSPGKDKFLILSVPTYSSEEVERRAFRIYVPHQGAFELRIGFVDDDKKPLQSARVFQPGKPKSFPLPPGETLLSIRHPRGQGRGAILLGDQEMFAYQVNESANGYSSGSTNFVRAYTPRFGSPLQIASFSPGSAGESIEFAIARLSGGATP